jgi:hypothetical protein
MMGFYGADKDGAWSFESVLNLGNRPEYSLGTSVTVIAITTAGPRFGAVFMWHRALQPSDPILLNEI